MHAECCAEVFISDLTVLEHYLCENVFTFFTRHVYSQTLFPQGIIISEIAEDRQC